MKKLNYYIHTKQRRNGERELFIESPSQVISKDSHIVIQFNFNQTEVKGLYIPRMDVYYERLEKLHIQIKIKS